MVSVDFSDDCSSGVILQEQSGGHFRIKTEMNFNSWFLVSLVASWFYFSNLYSPILQNRIQSVNICSLLMRLWKELEYSAFCPSKYIISFLILGMWVTPLKRTELPTQLGPGQSTEPMKYWILSENKLSWLEWERLLEIGEYYISFSTVIPLFSYAN